MYGIVKFKPGNRSNHRKSEGLEGRAAKYDGVAKSQPYGVTAFFQDLDILDVCLRP
jgi:hypothetical protein